MKPLHLFVIALICIAAAVAMPASAGPADIAVTSSTLDPSVLMKGDTGTLTVEVKNNGADSVAVRSARLYGSGVVGLSDSYPSVGDIGAGTTKTFTFTVRADGARGRSTPSSSSTSRTAATSATRSRSRSRIPPSPHRSSGSLTPSLKEERPTSPSGSATPARTAYPASR